MSMRGFSMRDCMEMNTWCIIHTMNDSRLVDSLLQHLNNVCPQMGFRINRNPDR